MQPEKSFRLRVLSFRSAVSIVYQHFISLAKIDWQSGAFLVPSPFKTKSQMQLTNGQSIVGVFVRKSERYSLFDGVSERRQ